MEMITIETEEDKVLRKELRKEEKAYQRINRQQDSDSDDELNKVISKTLVTELCILAVVNRFSAIQFWRSQKNLNIF